jgi:hypothetical protein
MENHTPLQALSTKEGAYITIAGCLTALLLLL